MPNPRITGQVITLQKVYTGTITVETYDTIADSLSYLIPYLNSIKIALGITESGGSVTSSTQISSTRKGDVTLYVFSVVVTI